MGYDDKLTIINFNSQKKGLYSMPPDERSTYLSSVLEKEEPGICFLPGDDKRAGLNAVRGYGQYTIPNAEDTVLLYDTNKVQMKQPGVDLNSLVGDLSGLDLNQMVCPQVVVSSLKPYTAVVKEFNIVSWAYQLFEGKSVRMETRAESIVIFSQRLSVKTGKPVIISGEMNIDAAILDSIVKTRCTEMQKLFLGAIKPDMTEAGFLPSNMKTAATEFRHLFMMKVFRCSSNTTVQTRERQAVADCFIASKQLDLVETTLLDVEQVSGHVIDFMAILINFIKFLFY